MDISSALSLIQEKLKENVIESKHFKEKCLERSLDIEKVRELVQKNKILGIVEQDENLYKIWFFYETHKDLNIIMRIISSSKIKFITIFPSDSERRKRK